MANSELIRNQQQTSNQVDASYSVVVSGGGVKCEEKPELKALLPGIRLHFLRYALFPKNDSNVKATRIVDSTDEEFTLSDADASNGELKTTDNFIVARTPLNRGYVYLINAKDKNDYHELEVDEVGNLSHVIWNRDNLKQNGVTPKDIRVKENDQTHYKLVINDEKEKYKQYWIGFSPIQWSYAYHQKILDASDNEKRKRLMLLVESKAINKGEEEAQEHVLPYHKVAIAYYKDHGNQKINDTLNQIHQREKLEEQKGNNTAYEDLFVCLHDPIGAAEDIVDELGLETIRQKALLESIQTGRDAEVVLKRMLRAEKGSELSEEEAQIGAMVNLALTQYKLIYGSDEMIEEYDGGKIGWSGGVYKPKLLNILGVAERKKQRQKIRLLQNELGTLLEKNFFKEAYHAHEHGSKLNLVDGKKSAIKFYKLLAIKPHLQDKAFDLKKDEEKDTRWDQLILESLKDTADTFPVYNVLNKKVDLDEATIKEGKKQDLSQKLALFVQEALETYAQYAMEDVVTVAELNGGEQPDNLSNEDALKQGIDLSNKGMGAMGLGLNYVEAVGKTTVNVTRLKSQTIRQTVKGNYELTLRRLNKLHVYGQEMFEVRGYEVRQQVQSAGWRLDNGKIVNGTYAGQKDLIRWVTTESPEIVLKETSHGRHVFDVPVTKEVEKVIRKEVVEKVEQATKSGAMAKAVLDGMPFRGAVALLQVFNLGAAMHTFSKDASVKNRLNVVGISAELTSATAYFLEKAMVTAVKDTTIRFFGKVGAWTNLIGAGVTVVMCSWDACLSFGARDKDAGFAWLGAGAAFLVVAVEAGMTVKMAMAAAAAGELAATSAPLGPWGWVAAGVGTGLVFLAYYLKDTPLETFFKNNALSDEEDFQKLEGESTAAFNKRFYLRRAMLCSDSDYQHWNDFRRAGAYLTDLLVSSGMEVNALKLIGKEESFSYLVHTFKTTGYIKQVSIGISFRQFLRSKDQLAYELYFFKHGISSTSEKIHLQKEPHISVNEGNEQQPPQVVLNLEIPDKYTDQYTPESVILFVSALSLGEGKFYPSAYSDDTRLLGAYFGVFQAEVLEAGRRSYNISTKIELLQSQIAIAPLNQLRSGAAWKKN